MNRVAIVFTAFCLAVARAQFVAQCQFTGNAQVSGSIQFNQASGAPGLSMDVSLTGSGLNNNPWHIHEFAVQSGNCGSTGGHYNPTTDYGELSSKYGNITGSPFTHTFTDSSVTLIGDYSILGRAIVIHNGSNPTQRIACCTIGLKTASSLALPDYPVLVNDVVSATCNLVGSVTGTITLVQQKVSGQSASTVVEYPVGSTISINFTGVPTDEIGDPYHIHVSPVGAGDDCYATLGHYNPDNYMNFNSNYSGTVVAYGVGELSNKHGAANSSSGNYVHSYTDNAVMLYGPYSVLGRAIVVHNATNTTERLSCCNITASPSNGVVTPSSPAKAVTAKCEFNIGSATGAIYLYQPVGSYGVTINVTGVNITDPAEQGSHPYHIHIYAPDYETASCGVTGAHYAPLNGIGPDSWGIAWNAPANIQVMEAGDLSGKHGLLQPNVDVTYNDTQISLTGPYGVIGRAIVIHSQSSSTRIACCTIGLVAEPTVITTTTGAGSTSSGSGTATVTGSTSTTGSSASSIAVSFVLMVIALIVAF